MSILKAISIGFPFKFMDILELTGFPNRPCLWSLHAPLSSSSFLSLLPIVLADIQTEIDELSNQVL